MIKKSLPTQAGNAKVPNAHPSAQIQIQNTMAKNLFDLTEIATRCGITDKKCAEIILSSSWDAKRASINAMIVGTEHRREVEADARRLLGK